MKEEVIDKLERIYHQSEKLLCIIFAKNDYSESGWSEWDNAVKLRDLAYDAYKAVLFYREED